MKLTLTHVKRYDKTGAKGPYVSLSIKAKEYGETFLSGFGNKDNANWKVGDEVEVAEVKKVEKDGKTYHNFEMPKSSNLGNSELLTRIGKMEFVIMNEMLPMIRAMHKEVTKVPIPDFGEKESEFNGI